MKTRERRRDVDSTPPAPGDLELVRSSLSVHDHQGDDKMSLPPSSESLREFFVERGLLLPDEPADPGELRTALRVHQALHRTVLGGDARDTVTVDEAAREAGLELRFSAEAPPRIEPRAGGVLGALGRILAVAFLAQIDGSWNHLKVCSSETCSAVFFDRSKNHSGRWCSMQECGNRNKVRAWRARKKAAGDTVG